MGSGKREGEKGNGHGDGEDVCMGKHCALLFGCVIRPRFSFSFLFSVDCAGSFRRGLAIHRQQASALVLDWEGRPNCVHPLAYTLAKLIT